MSPPNSIPGGAAEAVHRRPRADRAIELRPGRERGGDDRQRARRHQGAAEALRRASDDQRRAVRREAPGQRGEPEHEQRHHEHAALAEVVGRAPAEHQEAGESDRVGVDDPLQFWRREAEAQLDRGQRDVDDAQVEDDHELRDAAHAQQPCLARAEPALGRSAAVAPRVLSVSRCSCQRSTARTRRRRNQCRGSGLRKRLAPGTPGRVGAEVRERRQEAGR